MEILDGRGRHMGGIRDKNRERVRKYFIKNPATTIKSCCDSLGLSFPTVKRHIISIKKEV